MKLVEMHQGLLVVRRLIKAAAVPEGQLVADLLWIVGDGERSGIPVPQP